MKESSEPVNPILLLILNILLVSRFFDFLKSDVDWLSLAKTIPFLHFIAKAVVKGSASLYSNSSI